MEDLKNIDEKIVRQRYKKRYFSIIKIQNDSKV